MGDPAVTNTDLATQLAQLSQQFADFRQQMSTELEQLRGENRQLQDRNQQMQDRNQQLQDQIEQLMGELNATKQKLEEATAQNEEFRKRANSTKVSVKGVSEATTKDEVKTQVLAVTEGLPAHAILDVYQSGPCRIVVLNTLASAIQVLKAQNKLYRATQWRMDRCLTKKQREARAALGPRYLELKQAGAYPRFHGTALMVRMTSGVKPEAEWNPALKLPPRPAATGQQQQQQQGGSFAGAVRGNRSNGASSSGGNGA